MVTNKLKSNQCVISKCLILGEKLIFGSSDGFKTIN